MAAPPSDKAGSEILTAWPRSAQVAAAALLVLATGLLAVRGYQTSRFAGRPTELVRGDGLPYRIDLNNASRAELLQLPGVGGALADRIEEHRRTSGAFHRVDDLREVSGVGPAKLERLRPYVTVRPEEAEEGNRAPAASKSRSTASRSTKSRKEAALTQPIDLNRATEEELQKLPGIGPKLAQRIVEERRKSLFKTTDDLRRVSGIGPKTLEKLRPHVTTSSPGEQVAAMD